MTAPITLPRACCQWDEYVRAYGPFRHLTVRLATPEEREHAGNFWATGRPMKAKKYVMVDADEPTELLGAFGLVEGASSRAEIVFWAERFASKNDWHFIRPDGWEGVVGLLPKDPE